MSKEEGKNTPDEGLLTDAIGEAVLATEGVFSLVEDWSQALSRNVLGKAPRYTGIRVDVESLTADVFVAVEYGVNIPTVAWNIQTNVEERVREKLKTDMTAVNIHVQGVQMPFEQE